MSSKISVSVIETPKETTLARDIRYKVFVVEQNVPHEIEYDEFEETSTHVIAFLGDQAVGTARWRSTEQGFKLERFAVPKQYRGKGVGAALVHFILQQLDDPSRAYLNSQVSAIEFYEKQGFKTMGKIFFEADIPHKKMIR
jgi:predicted GNAT family N-acyltransferase